MASASTEKELAEYGIQPSMLLANNPPEVPFVTNQLVLELFKFKDQHGCTVKQVNEWIKKLFGSRWPEQQGPSYQATTRSIFRLRAKFDKLRKQSASSEKEASIAEFFQQEYALPKLGYIHGQVVSFSPPKKLISRKEYDDLKQKLYAATRNANKKLKRREEKLELQKVKIIDQDHQIVKYKKKMSGLETQLSKLRNNLDKVNHRAIYWRKKSQDIKDYDSVKRGKFQEEIKKLHDELSDLSLENCELQDSIESIVSEELTTFEHGRYSDDVRVCIYELLSLNVGVRNVAPIIRCVLKNIAHKTVDRLPSHGLTCQMILESLTILQAQLGEKLTESSAIHTTLQTDGTTKFGKKYGTYDVCLPSDSGQVTYTLGLRHIFSGAAQDTLDTFKEILADIDCVHQHLGKNPASGAIVQKLKNTMSDRHAAEKLFNDLLHDYRAEILPSIVQNWNSLTEIEQEQMTNMNNFFCGLHFLIALADSAEASVKIWETQNLDGAPPTSTSGTQTLVRTSCKAFHHKGSQQCGSSTLFRVFLKKEQGIAHIPLARFVGNRFNILFYDAAGVYYLRKHMVKFIETAHGTKANLLLQAVCRDLKNPIYVSGCRAFGLIDKVITGPIWRKLRESSSSILKMGEVYCMLKERLDGWSANAKDVVTGNASLPPAEFVMHHDEVWDELINPTMETDELTQELLQLLFTALSATTQRLLLDHLPGGKYHSDSMTSAQDTAEEISYSVPTTNVSPERDFAILDRLLREKPNANLIAIESMMVYSKNKTSIWLQQQAQDDRSQLIKAARARVPLVRKQDKARQEEIASRYEEALIKKQSDVSRKQLKRDLTLEKLTKEMEKVGLWESVAAVDAGLCGNSTKTKISHLKLQINYRRKILGQTHNDKSVFKFSCNRRAFSIEQLRHNLCQLLNTAVPASLSQVINTPTQLVGKRIKHCFQEDDNLVWYTGTVLSVDEEMMFEVQYDSESDVYSFKLLDDITNGDLVLL